MRLGERVWTMRPTPGAVAAIERHTGMDFDEVAREVWENDDRVDTMAAVLWAGIAAAHDGAPGFDVVGEMMMERGTLAVLKPVLVFLALAQAREHAAATRAIFGLAMTETFAGDRPMVNDIRGEVAVALGGGNWTMRPTFQAIREIQGKTGKDILTVAGECWEGRFDAVTVAAVLWAAIRAAHDDAPEFEEVGAMIVEEGITTFFESVLAFLANALAGLGAGEDEGEEKNA